MKHYGLHPMVIAAHIADTTNGACRQSSRRVSRATLFAGALCVLVLTYFGVRIA